MERDPLGDVLHSIRLTGAVFYVVECTAPWAAEAPPAAEVAGALLPGADHVFEFHALVEGECWAGPIGAPPVRLAAGDVVSFPRGEPHALSSAPGLRAAPDPAVFRRTLGEPLPLRLTCGGGDGARARVVCGFLGCDARPFNPLLAALPRVLHATRADGGAWLARLLDLALEESSGRRPASGPVLARASELMFIDLVRRHLDALPPGQAGWLAGLRDPFVGRALARLHARPADPWTLARLAKEVGLSRSALAERFTRLAGEPPMHYLARWRMQLASVRLVAGASVQEAAGEVGYGSEAAFSRAFKRLVGTPPAGWGAARRPAPAGGPGAVPAGPPGP